MFGYIYKCTYNNKIYIGESINALDPNYIGSGKYWRSVVKNNKKEVVKTILETIEAEDIKTLKSIMHKREIYWINKFDSTNPNIGYNISPGGCLMSEESLLKMKINDSKAIKHIMETTDCKKRISKSLKEYKQLNGVSNEHKKHLSESLKGRNIGCNGDSRSIQVYCVINGNKYSFHNKIQAAKWWYDNFPFSENYAEITYTRMINKSINGLKLVYNKKPINQNIQWFKEIVDINNNTKVYCIFNNKQYDFDNLFDAIKWWHINYPISSEYEENVYIDKLIKNIKGFEISYHSIVYNNIQWYRKE